MALAKMLPDSTMLHFYSDHAMQQKAMTSDADLSSMFALAPVSLWLEDYSALRSLLEQ